MTRPRWLPITVTPSLLATSALLAWGLLPAGPASGRPTAAPAPAPSSALPLAWRVREALRNDLPSRADYERMERGYYEQLLDAGRRPAALSAAAAAHPGGALAGHAEPFR